jgi:hypothetical protein
VSMSARKSAALCTRGSRDPKKNSPDKIVGAVQERSGVVLLSHTVSRAVPLALASLTSEFGMGSGVTSPL